MLKKYGTHIKKTASGAKTIFCNIFSTKFITFFLCSYQVIAKINSNFQFFVDFGIYCLFIGNVSKLFMKTS